MSPGVSRRTVLQGVGGVAFLGASAGALTLFNTDGKSQTPQSCSSTDLSSTEKDLIVSNWAGYLDPPKKATSTINVFEEETGIAVEYTDDVTDNNDFFAKVANQLGSCTSVKRDIFVLTDWMAAKMIGLGWIQELDPKNIPNVHANMLKNLQNPAWDPDRKHSAPWQSGLTGIAYNSDLVPEVGSFTDLLTRSDLKGKVTLLSEMPDTMGFALRASGHDPADFSLSDWDDAIELISKAQSDGQIRAFTGNEYTQDLAAGNIAACEAWSGDIIQMQFENPKIKFVVPEEGLSLWSDNMLVPNLATHKANAEAWMNYYYDPVNAAKLAAWVNYICPVEGAQEAMEKVDSSLVDNPLIFPDAAFLANTFSFMPLSESQNQIYQTDFDTVSGG